MLSKEFLTERGYCCGNGCFMCPYSPRHIENNTKLMSKEEWKKHFSKDSYTYTLFTNSVFSQV